MDLITTLAADIEQRWQTSGYQTSLLPDICRQELAKAEVPGRLGVQQLIDAWPELASSEPHPAPGILTLFRSSRLSIFAHLWIDAMATPHHHAWSGVFQVLDGSVLHTTFDFEEQERVSPRLRFGQLSTRQIDVLSAGDIVEVVPGASYIHGLWHSERPCLSLSVRGASLSDEMTLEYRQPGVAWQQRGPDESFQQILKLLDVLYQTSTKQYRETLDKIVREADAETVYLTLVHVVSGLGDIGSLDLIRDAVGGRQGEAFERIEAFWQELHRTELFQRVRRNLRDPELRFFFGALYFAADRGAVYDLIERRFPGQNSEDLVAQWIAAIMAPGDAQEQDPRRPLTARIFRLMTQGHSFEECFALLHPRSFDDPGPSADSVREIFRKIQSTALFRSLFVELEAA